ncbi:polysaccharide biosynthesis tyrosine autokinase [Curtobacterium sp. MCBD17_032]|uniref:polysaccharide biosynthesis tyrosine autokinase n=1 Tax=Curtobacterium sp. MCBD17_032 TaxID=2175659 RepID=UPI0015E8E492|nr:polysaccharide biosynthesis tyrosine autokinase [Curtobacterium sp. MCBD17_032]
MTLAQFIDVVRRYVWWVVLLVVLGAACGVAAAVLQPPQYRAQAKVFVSVGGATVSDLNQGGTFSEARVTSYAQLATSPRVLRAAARRAGLTSSVRDLAGSVSAVADADTVILTITATRNRPRAAALLANAVAQETIDAVTEVERAGRGASPLVHLALFQRAEPPNDPSSPRLAVAVVLGVLAGLVAGIGTALLRGSVDTKIRSVDALRRAAPTTVLAEIPVDDDMTRSPLIDLGNRYSERAEAFRQLRTHLTFTNVDGGQQSIVVTSAVPGEGKSSTAVNLALVMAQNGLDVLLVDADLRRPTTADQLGIESRVGLSTVLAHQVELEDAVQTVGEHGLRVLASGRVPPNPSELLASRQMELLMATVREQYEHVVIDAPPLLPVTDPAVLAAMATGVVLVGSVDGRVTNGQMAQAVATLDTVGARVLGVVANRVPVRGRPASYGGYRPSVPMSESPRRSRRSRPDDDRGAGS